MQEDVDDGIFREPLIVALAIVAILEIANPLSTEGTKNTNQPSKERSHENLFDLCDSSNSVIHRH